MGVPSPWVRIKIGLDKNRRPLNKMSWKWTVQLNKTSIRWTSIRTVCMESPLQGSLWPLTSASHMTIHNPKSELWPLFYLWICLEVYTEIYFVLIRLFSLFLFSPDSNSGLILCFVKVYFTRFLFFSASTRKKYFFSSPKLFPRPSDFPKFRIPIFHRQKYSKMFYSVFLALKCSILGLFFVFWIIDYWLNFSFADRAAGSWWTEGWLFSCPK